MKKKTAKIVVIIYRTIAGILTAGFGWILIRYVICEHLSTALQIVGIIALVGLVMGFYWYCEDISKGED